jgi:hypothetical protein
VARAEIVPNAPETVLTEVIVRLALTRAKNPPSPKNPLNRKRPNRILLPNEVGRGVLTLPS